MCSSDSTAILAALHTGLHGWWKCVHHCIDATSSQLRIAIHHYGRSCHVVFQSDSTMLTCCRTVPIDTEPLARGSLCRAQVSGVFLSSWPAGQAYLQPHYGGRHGLWQVVWYVWWKAYGQVVGLKGVTNSTHCAARLMRGIVLAHRKRRQQQSSTGQGSGCLSGNMRNRQLKTVPKKTQTDQCMHTVQEAHPAT